MELETERKLSGLTTKINSLTSVLLGYCNNFAESSKEISNLIDFVEILDKTAYELYDLL